MGDLRDGEFVAALWSDHGPRTARYHVALYAAEGLSHLIRAYNYTVAPTDAGTRDTIPEPADDVAAAFGAERGLEHLPARNGVVHAIPGHGKVRGVFTPTSGMDLDEAITPSAARVTDRGAHDPVDFVGEIEIERNLATGRRERDARGAGQAPRRT